MCLFISFPTFKGITALIALNILERFDISKLTVNSTEYLHLLVEALRFGFADSRQYVADPERVLIHTRARVHTHSHTHSHTRGHLIRQAHKHTQAHT